MDDCGKPLTLPGALILRLSEDGRCEDLREYYNVEEGARHPPHERWGT